MVEPITDDKEIAGRIDYARVQITVHNAIMRGGRRAVLRTNTTGVLRKCHVILMSWKVQELMSGLYDPLSQKGLFSSIELATPPNHETESLLLYTYPMTDPPSYGDAKKLKSPAVPFNQSGLVVYWYMPLWDLT
jgi:hypothetical protein